MAKNAKTVKVTFLGGVGEVGKNMTAIECGDDMIIVDCGVSFATSEEAPGIDAIIPDITYVKENISKLRGIVLRTVTKTTSAQSRTMRTTSKTFPSTALRSQSDF